MVKSIAELDQKEEGVVAPRVVPIKSRSAPPPAGMINSNGPLRPFRTVQDLEEDMSAFHVVHF